MRQLLKMRSESMELSVETTTLMFKVMAELHMDDPEFAIEAALRNWIRYRPSIEAVRRFVTGHKPADELAAPAITPPLQ
jgi:hypothetical protein